MTLKSSVELPGGKKDSKNDARKKCQAWRSNVIADDVKKTFRLGW